MTSKLVMLNPAPSLLNYYRLIPNVVRLSEHLEPFNHIYEVSLYDE